MVITNSIHPVTHANEGEKCRNSEKHRYPRYLILKNVLTLIYCGKVY
jgi:hypothetical protein